MNCPQIGCAQRASILNIIISLIALCFTQAANAQATEDNPNLLANPRFANAQNGAPMGWAPFEGGFKMAPRDGRNGRDAIVMERGANEKACGIRQVVIVNGDKPSPITISGWSKAQNVSGTPDNNYALYVDLTFTDNTHLWGQHASFATGTHDWKLATLVINPAKPVASISFHALLREHTGKAWFCDLSVSTRKRVVAAIPLVAVAPVKPPRATKYFGRVNDAQAVMPIAKAGFVNLLRNPQWMQIENGSPAAWRKWGDGFSWQGGAGREGHNAIVVERAEKDGERGIVQEVILNQTTPQPLQLSGWSKAQNVSGASDANYSLYADLTFQDGTALWGESTSFGVGTHDWERAEHIIVPAKPIKSISIYALFRGHSGRAWFSDLSLAEMKAPVGMALFDSLLVSRPARPPAKPSIKATTYSTKDGLQLSLDGTGRVASLQIDGREVAHQSTPGGFLVRDVANNSGFHTFKNQQAPELKLNLQSRIESAADHIAISGRVSDLSGADRAISLAFALPIEARGWQWDEHIREARVISGEAEYSNTVSFAAGANGRHSLYPLANIHNAQSGLSIALDMNFASQNRIAYNAATRQIFIVYDFGLTPEKSSAEFRFVIYRSDPQWGFRSAVEKLYRIFPAMFEVREANKKQGLWMPFTEIKQVEGWRDFGFRYREAGDDQSVSWDDRNDILTFRYTEPMTWWMPMPPDVPRTYENALAQMQSIASNTGHRHYSFAQAVLSSGFRNESGRYPILFRNEPWANGAVWSLNVSPQLPGLHTGASIGWTTTLRDKLYRNNPNGELDGEYLDSMEGYVTAHLNFDRDQWAHSQAPLTFATGSTTPAQHKAFSVYEFAKRQSREVHEIGKLMFANSVPDRFTFLAPWLDVMGSETNWLPANQYKPDDDAKMNLRRTMSGQKPYLLLQNTDFEKFTPNYVAKYFERSLFYGIFPSFFSADAATSPYWLNPKWINRDRSLFKKFIPIIQAVAEAGWQPVTLATSDNAEVWIERFGNAGGPRYLTLRNNNTQAQTAKITLQSTLLATTTVEDMMSGQNVPIREPVLTRTLQPDQTVVLRLR